MDNIDPLTGLPLPGTEQNVPASSGQSAESNVASLKDVLGGALKKEFPSDEAALKAVVDTFSFVGKKQEQALPVQQNDSSAAPVTKAEFEQLASTLRVEQFYVSHPEFKEFRDLISSMGSDPESVVRTDVFQKAYAALKAQNENQKEPLRSNSRIALPNDNSDYNRDLELARATEDWTGFMTKHKGLAAPQ